MGDRASLRSIGIERSPVILDCKAALMKTMSFQEEPGHNYIARRGPIKGSVPLHITKTSSGPSSTFQSNFFLFFKNQSAIRTFSFESRLKQNLNPRRQSTGYFTVVRLGTGSSVNTQKDFQQLFLSCFQNRQSNNFSQPRYPPTAPNARSQKPRCICLTCKTEYPYPTTNQTS